MCSLKTWKRNEKLRRKGNEKEAEKEKMKGGWERQQGIRTKWRMKRKLQKRKEGKYNSDVLDDLKCQALPSFMSEVYS